MLPARLATAGCSNIMPTDLILGGGGFIGRHVGLALAGMGHRVRLAGRGSGEPLRTRLDGSLTFETLDLGTADWDRLLQDVDVVHHYAWSSIPQIADADPVGDLDTNVRGTVALLQALRRRGNGRLVFASSGGTVYGRIKSAPVPEDHSLEPISLYGAAKAAAEQYVGVYRRAHGIDCRIARLSNPFGIGQKIERNQGAVTVFTHKALSNETIAIYGDGTIVRDYIHISDAVSGLVALAQTPLGPDAPSVYNFGSGRGTSLTAIVDALSSCLNRSVAVEYRPGRAYDVPVNVLDIERARMHLGWSPKLDLEAGIMRMIDDYASGSRSFSTLSPE